jgi:hypothetical protein
MQISEILHDSDYCQSQFDLILIHEFERKITTCINKTEKDISYLFLANRYFH